MDPQAKGNAAMLPKATEQPTTRVDEAAHVLGISRSAAYEGVRRGEIPSIRIGHRIVIPTAALRRMLELDPPSDDAIFRERETM